MKLTKILFGIGLSIAALFIVVIAIVACSQQKTDDNTGTALKFSMGDISTHNSADSCWLLIDGKVYDVTKFISTHPGGKAILPGCGKDATELYGSKGKQPPKTHSENARGLLANYYIGDLNQ